MYEFMSEKKLKEEGGERRGVGQTDKEREPATVRSQ